MRRKGTRRLEAARRRKKARRFIWDYGRYMAVCALMIVGALVVSVIAYAMAKQETAQDVEAEEHPARAAGAAAVLGEMITDPGTEAETAVIECREESEALPESDGEEEQPEEKDPWRIAPFWSAEDLDGFKEYTLPEEYAESGGYFPEVAQEYTFVVCAEKGVDYLTTLAVIENESGYQYEAAGADNDTGLMQIIPYWHYDRMERLEVTDIENPYQNILVGVDFLAELLDLYGGDYEKALTAYQYGTEGAEKHCFSRGVNCSRYAESVLQTAERIAEDMGACNE